MFGSDKDVKLGSRRGAQGRGSGGTHGAEGRDEVLEKARKERAERERARASRGPATTIQRCYRGRSAACRAREKHRADWDKKMSDYGTLQRALVARGIPFTPPLKFVLSSLQQLVFFYRIAQDSARLRLFCESVLVLCVAQPDPALNPAAHLLGVVASGSQGKEKGSAVDSSAAAAAAAAAGRLRLKRLLAACVGYFGKELNQGLAEGNAPLKVLLMLAGCPNHTRCPSTTPNPGLTPEAVEAHEAISRFCMGILVKENNILSAVRDVLLGTPTEQQAVASAGSIAPPRPTLGRQGAMLGCWELALQAVDSVDTLLSTPTRIATTSTATRSSSAAAAAAAAFSSTISPTFTSLSLSSLGSLSSAPAAALPPPPPPPSSLPQTPLFFRASFVAELLSVPLLPSRLGGDGVNLLLKQRKSLFVDCLRDFRRVMEGEQAGWEGGSLATFPPQAAVEADGRTGGDDQATQKSDSRRFGRGRPRLRTLLPDPPVSCCSTETFLVGNLAAMGTKLSLDGGGSGGGGGGGGEATAATAEEGAREQQEFMRVMTFLLALPHIPDSLLTDRQAITWRAKGQGGEGGGVTSMTALAVPQAVQDQVRLLVSDRWVRAASKKALGGINELRLKKMTEAEKRETKETLESSAADLALASVRRHRAEENRNFVSKWAEKLRQSSKSWFTYVGTGQSVLQPSMVAAPAPAAATPSTPGLPPAGAGSGLIDATAASRAAAKGDASAVGGGDSGGYSGGGGAGGGGAGAAGTVDPEDRPHEYDKGSVLALCELLAVLLRRWGTGANAANPVMQSVMNTLSFSLPCAARLWAFILNEISGGFVSSSASVAFDRLCDAVPIESAVGGGLHASLVVMVCLFAHLLVVLDDAELYEAGQPLPLHHINTLVRGLKRPLFVFYWDDGEASSPPAAAHFGTFFASAAERLLRGLYARDSRRTLCRSEAWVIPQAESKGVLSEVKSQSRRARRLVRCMPYCMSLTQRMRVFEHLVKADKGVHQPENTPGVPIRVRRGHVLEDGLAALGSGGRAERQTKRRLCVFYVGAAGHEESGIDMGGLFKDFWTDLSALAFDVNYGLFRMTKEGLMYPNPSSSVVHGSEHLRLFEFLGRILGKALYEGITVQPEFATFFLGFIRGDYNFLHLFHDLHGLDPELYKNLMFLKTYSGGDVEDLCLTFTVTENAFGANKEVDLIRGGSRRAVTSANRLEYVNRVAKHHLVDCLKPQAEAFVRGLWEVIDPLWLQMFSEPELQVLISGSNKTLDVEDLKRHTKYSGGFVGVDRSVRRFWSIVESMNDAEKAALLRFVTSCERPPPLGFESMHPPFCLHRVGIRSDGERLPTASTCFNTLKLPTYSSEKVMKAKLLTSIFSGTGFELS